jgi:hypothetical protein
MDQYPDALEEVDTDSPIPLVINEMEIKVFVDSDQMHDHATRKLVTSII